MLNRLLEFEEKRKITKYKFASNNDMIWPYFRTIVYNNIFTKKENITNKVFKTFPIKNKMEKLLWKNPFSAGKHDILFVQSCADFIEDSTGKKYNRIVDYYADIYKNETLKLEFSSIQKHPDNRTFNNVKYLEIIDELVEMQTFITYNKKLLKEDIENVKQMINVLRDEFSDILEEGFFIGLENQILKMSVSINYYYYYYAKLLKQINPKIIFIDNGCYGGQRVSLIKLANENGIKTAEFQHGYIGKNNFVYNYPDNFYGKDKYREYMPQYFMAMGEYFVEGINMLPQKIIIGNAHLYTQLSLNNELMIKNSILILSDWGQRQSYINIVKEFVELDSESNYKIIFRIHPSDRNNIYLYKELAQYKNVIISDKENLYDDIKRAEIIVGCYSTAIFESIPFNKSIMIIENEVTTKYMDKKIGIWFENGKQLFDIVNSGKHIKKYDVEYYWNSKWKENYINFIENIVYKK